MTQRSHLLCYPGSRLLAILLLFLYGHAAAQETIGLNKDSLRRLLFSLREDTPRVHVLISMGQQFDYTQPDSAIYFYSEAGRLSRKLRYPAGFIRYVANYTDILNNRGKFEESLALNLQAIDTCLKYGLGGLSYIRAFMNTATVYQYKGEYATSAGYYLKALAVVEAGDYVQAASVIYNDLCGLYRNLEQPDKAIVYARKSLQLAEKDHDLLAAGNACINLGNSLKDKGQMSQGLSYIERSRAIGLQLHDSSLVETALIDIGDTHIKTSNPEKAIPAFREALSLARALGDVPGEAFALQGMAMGNFWTARYPDAERYLLQSIPLARDHDQKEVWRNSLMLMSDVQIALGHTKASLQYRRLYDSVSDALLNPALMKNIQELETKYEVEKKKHDLLQKDFLLEEKDREASRQRTWLIAAAASVLILTVLFVLSWRFSRQQQLLQQRTIKALEMERENVRLKAMLEGQYTERQRISQEMHDDMGSGLTSLIFLSRMLGSDGAPAAPAPGDIVLKMRNTAEQLVRKMNEVIWTMNHEQDTLDSLLAYIRVNTAEMLEHAGIDFRFDIEQPVPAVAVSQEFRRNIYLAAKEAVHNVVRHSGAGMVVINISAGGGRLEIRIHDDGKGFTISSGNRFGNGLKNMRRRTEQVGGSIEFVAGQGTLAIIRAPLPVA